MKISYLFITLTAVFVSGCVETVMPQEQHIDRVLRGQSTYNVFCAECHNAGDDHTPSLAKKDDWSNRSLIWKSILNDHVKKGYLNMPAKGGNSFLTDENIAGAVEYMEWYISGMRVNLDTK